MIHLYQTGEQFITSFIEGAAIRKTNQKLLTDSIPLK